MNNLQLYNLNSVEISVLLFIAVVICNELCFRFGRFVQANTNEEVKELTASIQGSIIGLLALLLGFSFSMSMQRFENRSMAVIDEANAIGTAVLRTELLPGNSGDDARNDLKRYVDVRIANGKLDLSKTEELGELKKQSTELQDNLWSLAVLVIAEDSRPVTTGAFITSLNDVFDSQVKRDTVVTMHVPQTVLLLLFIIFICTGGILGYTAGLRGKRVIAPVILVFVLITLIVYIVIDLDRPRRGLIQINQQPMLELPSMFLK